MAIYRGQGGSGDAVGDASSQATVATQKAAEAATSAASAATSALQANNVAIEVASSVDIAETAAITATNYANVAETASVVATTKASEASTSATNAASSASSASSSATSAGASATNAASSEASAATSATTATTQAGIATTKASEATSSASSAASSASSASSSASSASTSATNAANSASSAATSASTATTQASNALSSASSAATSASNAATSETNAASSASSASASATNAASSATSANSAKVAAESARDATLAAFDSFDDRYLGTKTSDPTVDNDGNALLAGALYFNSTVGEMRLYNGTSWVAAYVSGVGFVSKSGDTMTGKLNLPASSSTSAGLNIGHGSNPSAPVNGDLWGTSSSVFYRATGGTNAVVAFTNVDQTYNGRPTLNNGLSALNVITLGGTTDTSTHNYGQSTVSQTVNVHAGATSSGNTKTLNIGTGGVSGSTTSISIGSTFGTSVTANGSWSFGSTISGSITGNAETVTNGVYTTGSYANPAWITSLGWSKLTSTPTTISGYGITDAQPLSSDLTSIAGLVGTSGFLKKTGAATYTLDTNTYLTTNQNITFTGDATGSGSTSVALTLANSGATAGTYNNSATAVTPITIDAKGRITGTGAAVTITPSWSNITSKPTTLSGFGITDGQTTLVSGTNIKTINGSSVLGSGNLIVSAGATGGGTDRVFVENDKTITTSYTIPSGKNAMTVSPITISSGVSVTVSSGSRWVIL